jgi:tetratricopeptide (TPR) repeat protein
VLHRDVKPSNVMVTPEGRVLLLDFGLSSAAGGERTTRTGSQLGSLAYMAPEQLDGGPLDARADVYALGATLYELLSLRLPYSASDPLRLRQLVASASRTRLSQLNPAVPWELETISATALDPDPSRRYESAAAFARDLDHVLAHRPIEARRANAGLRLRRWTQRHPARATGLAAAALALLVGPSVYAWQANRARRVITEQRDALSAANEALGTTNAELELARARADAEAARAQGNFEKLLLAVDAMLTRVGDESLRDVPRMETVRRELLAEAVRFYEGFLAEQPDDPGLRREAAEIHERMANLHGILGDHPAARRQLEQSARILHELAAEGAEVPTLARVEQGLAHVQRLQGELGPALAAAARAVELSAARTGAGADAAAELARSRLERGQALLDSGRLEDAEAELERSLAELEQASAESGGDLELSRALARTQDLLGVLLCQRGHSDPERSDDLSRSEALHGAARELWERLLADDPQDAQLRMDAARNLESLGVALSGLGRRAEALEAFRLGAEAVERLALDHPAMPFPRTLSASLRANAGGMLFELGRPAEALPEFERAEAAYEALVAADPADDYVVGGLCAARQGRALCLWKSERLEEALVVLARASEAQLRALAARPASPSYRWLGVKLREVEAEIELTRRNHAEAARAARALLDPALAPRQPLLAAGLLVRCARLAEVDGRLGAGKRLELSAAYLAETAELVEEAVRARTDLVSVGDEALAALRAEPELAELLLELEAGSGAER